MNYRRNKVKIAFIHSKCKPFRIEFFKKIQEKYDIDFFFYDENRGNLDNFNTIEVKKIPYLSDFYYAINLKEKLLSKEYDIYVSTDLGYHITYIAYEIAKSKNKKFILWNEQWKDIKHPRRTLMKFYENKIVKESDAILAFGERCNRFLVNRGADENKLIKIPNAVPKIDTKNLPIAKDYERYPVEFEGKLNILCIARLIPVKGHEYLIKSINLLKDKYHNIQLIIAGEGPMYYKLNELINKLNLQNSITMPGISVNEIQKWELYKKSDIVILPSVYTRHAEAWGLVVNEAAMLSKCIITTNMTGVAGEIVRDNESGIIVEEKNVEMLANSIEKLINDENLRYRYGNRAKELVDSEYTIDKMVEGFDKAIDKVRR